MQTVLQINKLPNHSRTTRAGSLLSTSTSTIMTVLLLASIGQGWLSVVLLAAAGLGFELLKWSSWQDAWQAHNSHQHDKRNILAALCTLAVVLSVAASIATTRSNLTVGAGVYIEATRQQALFLDQIRQKQEAIDVCTAANRITLCSIPLQAEVQELQEQLNRLMIPDPDEATALVTEISHITGLAFNDAATVLVVLVATMLDASGLYFLFKQTEKQPVYGVKAEALPTGSEQGSLPAAGLQTHVYGDVNLSVSLGIESTVKTALNLIQSVEVKPTVRNLSESGHFQRQEKGRGCKLS